MPMNFKSGFSNFITSGIKSPDPEIVTKFKVLNVFLFVLIIFSPLLSLFYFFIGAKLLFHATLSLTVLGILGIILLRITKSLLITGNYAFLILWATFMIIRWNTGAMSEGGLVLLCWIWNAALILMAIFLTGYMWGTIWGILIFLETGAAVYLFRRGYQFPNLIPSDISPLYSLGAYLAGLLAILLIAFLYEKGKNSAIEREQLKSRGLVESKKYIDTLLERFPFPTFVIDGEHRVIQWNRACELMTGISSKEVIGKKVPSSLCVDDQWSLADIIIEDPDSITSKFSDSIVSTTESGYYEIGIPLPTIKEGIQAIVTVAPIFDVNGSIKGAIETIQDVTNPYRGTSNGYGSHTQSSELDSNPIFKIDSNGTISFWNKASEEIFGYSASEMLGTSPLKFVSKSTRKPFRETIVKVFKGESFNGREWKYYSAQGDPVYVFARAYPLSSIDGKPKECVIVNTDITDLALRMKRLERETTETKEKLKSMADEYALLRRNLATYIRKKEQE